MTPSWATPLRKGPGAHGIAVAGEGDHAVVRCVDDVEMLGVVEDEDGDVPGMERFGADVEDGVVDVCSRDAQESAIDDGTAWLAVGYSYSKEPGDSLGQETTKRRP